MIARHWRGWTRLEEAEPYVDYLNETGVPGLGGTPGNEGVFVLWRPVGDRAEFIVLSLWESRDAIKAFAGEDIERAPVLSRGRALPGRARAHVHPLRSRGHGLK